MHNIYDSQPAKYFALLEGWRQVIVAILGLLQDVSCYHIHDYLDLFFGHYGDETAATACESCHPLWLQLEDLKSLIDGQQRSVHYILKVFWKTRPPRLSHTSRWLKEKDLGISVEEIQAYHYTVLHNESYDAFTGYVLAYGPAAYERTLIHAPRRSVHKGDSGCNDQPLPVETVMRQCTDRFSPSGHRPISPVMPANVSNARVAIRPPGSSVCSGSIARVQPRGKACYVALEYLESINAVDAIFSCAKNSYDKHLLDHDAGIDGICKGYAWLYLTFTPDVDRKRQSWSSMPVYFTVLGNMVGRDMHSVVLGTSSNMMALFRQ